MFLYVRATINTVKALPFLKNKMNISVSVSDEIVNWVYYMVYYYMYSRTD